MAAFESTRWSLVAAAESGSALALETLCERYWGPLYLYVRRQGYAVPDAQDLVQAWFLRLLEKDYLSQADPSRGKFRSFLLASLKHFLANEWDRNRTIKRGGGSVFACPDVTPSPTLTPEQVYERGWAIAVLERVTKRLQVEFENAGKSIVFAQLKVSLTGDHLDYAAVAAQLSMNEGSVRVAVHRLRDRFRALLRTEIAQTLATPDARNIDEELCNIRRFLLL